MVTREKIPVNLTKDEERAVFLLLKRLQEKLGSHMCQAMLFGSKARGDSTTESDIDLLILVKKETWTLKDEISGITADINLEYDLLMDVRVIGLERWNHMAKIQAGLYRTISQDAIPLAA